MDDKDRETRFYLALLLALAIPFFALGISNHGVWTADEPRVAEIGREMALSGNWAVPTLNRRPFLEEPPLYYAAVAAVFRVTGIHSDRVVRIPSALFAFGGALGLFFLGRKLFGPATGFAASFVLATCGEYFRVAHWVIVDSALTCFVILSLTFFMFAYLSHEHTARRLVYYILCYVSCALAFYAKGFVGVAIPGLAILSFLLLDRNLKEIPRMRLWLGAVIFLLLTLPWFFALWLHGGPEYLKVFLVHNHLERFAGGTSGHAQPFYYYLTQFPTAFLPWSLLLVPVLFRGFRAVWAGQPGDTARKGLLFALCWFVAGFVFLSAASTKRALYLMPILAPISLCTAWYMGETIRGHRGRLDAVFCLAFAIAVLLVALSVAPLLVLASRKYGIGYPPREVFWAVLLSGAALVFAVTALLRYGSDMARFWACSGAGVLALLLVGAIALCPVLDRFKSFVPFCNAVTAAVPGESNLYGYRPDETLRGAVPFYTGRFLTEIGTRAELHEALRREKTVFIVIRDKRNQVEKELLSTGWVRVISRFGMDASRSLVLLKGHGDEATGDAAPRPAITTHTMEAR
jgi:4-amino-4-deoxy-L-arabinose transferase-like glycosyltransferase